MLSPCNNLPGCLSFLFPGQLACYQGFKAHLFSDTCPQRLMEGGRFWAEGVADEAQVQVARAPTCLFLWLVLLPVSYRVPPQGVRASFPIVWEDVPFPVSRAVEPSGAALTALESGL